MCDGLMQSLAKYDDTRKAFIPAALAIQKTLSDRSLSPKFHRAAQALEKKYETISGAMSSGVWDPGTVVGKAGSFTAEVRSLIYEIRLLPSEERLPSKVGALVKSIIVANDKTSEGRLVAAASIPWFDIIRILRNDPSAAFQIPPYKWEEIVAGAYHKAGFHEVIITPRSKDRGRDVIATMRGLGSIRIIDQVKAYRIGRLVTANDVRALYGVLIADGASKGFLTTTSDFAPQLVSDPLLSPLIPSRIELVNGQRLLSRLETLAATKP
jgi:restriction system protein